MLITLKVLGLRLNVTRSFHFFCRISSGLKLSFEWLHTRVSLKKIFVFLVLR